MPLTSAKAHKYTVQAVEEAKAKGYNIVHDGFSVRFMES